ncbi:MAG TPA: GDL motif peptide-associated radical SAM/SPASM maturase [Pyrinomonadaceae bacterium]|nr:GDL motif peptide-associated radical SAM/SPASM maturase [Pyrinomonadaceae bacterium]
MAEPARYLTFEDRAAFTPVYAVWEITLACDLKCQHCGSRAGKRRPSELSTEECLDLVRQMARLGTREVTLIGGEAYLRRDWLEIIREIRLQGMNCTLQTGGLHLNEERIRQAADAGLQGAGVSIDGLKDLHDRLRGVKGSFEAAFNALRLLKKYDLAPSVNTQITSGVIPQLRELMHLFIDAGARDWQLQLTVAMGRAADHPELLLQPYEMLVLMPLISELYTEGLEHDFHVQPGNNIGYFGPYEAVWRGKDEHGVHWMSCNAGQNTLGIEADGAIKGCPSLPTSPYTGANIRDLTLEDIWNTTPELSFTRTRTTADLWGFCGTCYYADVCRAGCTWTTHVLFGRAGNNPYCHHRALELDKQGLRERIVQTAAAPGTPFDHGSFDLVVETNDGRPLSPELHGQTTNAPLAPVAAAGSLVQIKSARKRPVAKSATTAQAQPMMQFLNICRGCNRHVMPEEVTCPHCDGDLKTLERDYEKRMRAARRAYRQLLKYLPQM